MKKKQYFLFGFISFAAAICILLLMVFSNNLQTQSLLQDRVFYILLLLMGVFSAIALFGFIKSTAKVEGNTYGLGIQIGGPAAFAAIVVIGGFFLIPRSDYFDLTVRAVDEKGMAVYSERKAKVIVNLATGVRQADFTKNGEAVIKAIPTRFLNSNSKIIVDIYFYDQIDASDLYRLSTDVIEVPMKFNATGTTTGILNKKRAHLMVANLLLPYRLISDDIEVSGANVDQYYSEKFIKKAVTFPVGNIIDLSKERIEHLCDILIENSPESLNVRWKSYLELINQTAIRFKRDVGMLSQIDTEGIDPEIQRELIALSLSNFVQIASGITLDQDGLDFIYGNTAFWNDFAREMKELEKSNVINLFTEFSGF